MHAREDIGICRLARILAIAILMCGTTVSQGQITINVPDGTYTEQIVIASPYPPESYYGVDLFAPELLDPGILIKKVEDPDRSYVHWYIFEVKALTDGGGPECIAKLRTDAMVQVGDQYGTWTYSGATVTAFTDFDFVVYNKTGTDIEYFVPLIFEGTLVAEVSHEEHGTSPFWDSKVKATAFIGFYECPHDWQDPAIGRYDLALYHNYYGETLPSNVTDWKPWFLTAPVLVGKEPGDRACMTVCSQAAVTGGASAYSNSDHPELNSYSKISGTAVVDPYIYIDPTWEHADKFGIVFPDNVTPLTDPPRLLFFDSFETGDTTVWSNAVP